MESIYNAAGGGFKIYVLDSVCSKIIQNNHEVRDDDIRVLLQLYGQLFLKALELIDKEYVELITILNTDRYYFSVQGSDGFYTLYPHVNFCQCLMFRFNVSKNEKDVMCKHILACHLALALNKFKRRNTPDFVYKFS